MTSTMKPLLILTCVLSFLTPFVSGQSRGVWFWGSTTLPGGGASPWGSTDVVGNAALEDDTVGFLTAHFVDRIFGSYGNRPVTEAAVIAAWNEKLFLNGISSQLLLSGSGVNDPAEVANWQAKIANRLIAFNDTASFTPSQKFKALHLDLEPQQLAAWGGGDGDVKKGLLNDLLNVYSLIRTQLDTAGYSSLPMYADIPFFWDKLPDDGGSVNWLTAAERDTWFAAVASELEGVSVMTFSKDNSPALQVATDYERSGPLFGKAVIAIQPKIGAGELWLDYPDFETVLHQLEDDVLPIQATDIENYGFWRHAISTTEILPAITDVIEVAHDPDTGGGVVIIHGVPGHVYILRQSSDLDGWVELTRVRMQEAGDARFPFETDRASKFFQVEVVEDRS